jgi:hypothetical protein
MAGENSISNPKYRARLLERFNKKYEPEPMSGCWLWTGALIGSSGYGFIGYGGRKPNGTSMYQLAHRISYELFKGPIPDGLQIDHLCRVHGCVNPDHLEAVTCKTNVARGIRWKIPSPALCPQGHEYSPDNVYVSKRSGCRPSRRCKICHKVAEKRRYERARIQ